MSFVVPFSVLPIRINADGDWLHGDDPLFPEAVQLFERHIVIEEDGVYWLRLGLSYVPLDVDDTAYFVRSVAIYKTPDGKAIERVELVISDGEQETLDPETLMQGPDNVLYCRINRCDYLVPCRFPPHYYHALALHAAMEGERTYFPINGSAHFIKPYNARPAPIGDPHG